MKLTNTVFIFESKEDLVDFWDNHIMQIQGEITNNTFIVTKRRWILRLLTWILGN